LLRLGLGLVVVVMALVETQGLVQTLRGQSRESERVVRGIRGAMVAARPRLGAALLPGGPGAWQAVADEALGSALASEVELFDLGGKRRLARPSASPVQHWPSLAELDAVRAGELRIFGPIGASRVLTYAAQRSGDEQVLLRFSTAVPALAESLDERRQVLLGHGVTLVVLLCAGALVLFPPASSSPASTGALDAYEQAMQRLTDRGRELSIQAEAERRRMEGLIEDKEAMARAGELTAGIAHEVRNGLGTILGYARLLERGEASDVAEAARLIREECETLETVVKRFMDFVKRETLSVSSFELRRMLSRVLARESRSRPGAEASLADSGEPGTMLGDEELLERAFENLVRNAREAAGQGGHVWVETSGEAGSAVVTIADDGPGLAAEFRGQLRPFFTTKPGGLGLGLPLALKIVRVHRGEVTFADRSPRGLTVTVRLPLSGGAA
jgi:signal transduction histidine kinase